MENEVYNDKIQTVLAVTEETPQTNDTITLSTGVVLKRKEFPKSRILALLDQFPDPEVPLVMNPEKGRMERNPKNETYVRDVETVNMQRGMAMLDIILVSGTDIVSIPEGFSSPDDDEWVEELELSHIAVKRDSKLARKFAWIKYVAAKNDDDLASLFTFAQSGVGESEVMVAQELSENFPDH